MYTVNGKWKHGGQAWTNWCEGFLGGQLWLISQLADESFDFGRSQSWWRQQAEHYSKSIEHRKTDRSVHDLGFLFWSTWKRWFDLTGDPATNAVVIEAGSTLSKRFMERGRYLHSFVSEDSLFIDIMMNVGLIFYAAQETGDDRMLWIANEHCLTSRRTLVRGDGSVAHEGIFDTESGEFLRQSTHQGYRGDSSWARGLAWALYGFGTAYSFSGDARFLETSRACADYYIERTPPHGVPPNDWDEPEPDLAFESSAAAIAASGLLNLAQLVDNADLSDYYGTYALHILDTLTTPDFLAEGMPGWEGVLRHGIYHQKKKLGVDESVMWGDYFFLEAISKVLVDE